MQDLKGELLGQHGGGKGELRKDEFWAVKDISFELKRGECLGLIGHNGAGKTTLLRILNGLVKLDQGRIEMRGRLGALIALGAGFNPVLTGRENIYTNAAVLGLSKSQVDAKFDEVLEFADIGDFIDTPVQNYSSGMSVRLGFAVAAVMIEPDVLFLDEVLAVGDIGFVIKCLNRVRQLTEKSAVIFVSHNMQFVSSFCTRVMVMDHGQTLLDSMNPADSIDKYYSLVKHDQQSSGVGGVELLDFKIQTEGEILQESEPVIVQGDNAQVLIKFRIDKNIPKTRFNLFIHDESYSPIVAFPLQNKDESSVIFTGKEYSISAELGKIELNAGKYSFVLSFQDADKSISLLRMQGVCPFRVSSKTTSWAKIYRPTNPVIIS
jgi:lipopolysaccharide transport system ATP-binding protein